MLRDRFVLVPTLLLVCSALAARGAGPEADWPTILGPGQGAPPAPRASVVWQSDLNQALGEARAEDRPLFVTLRCVPCKQCADFDAAVLEGGRELDPLLKQFVTVRLTDASTLDLRMFPVEGFQDLDLSWWGWFLAPDGRVLGVFGGRDEVSDSTRISPAALAKSLERVLAHYYDPRRASWAVDGPAPALGGEPHTPRSLEGFASWKRQSNYPSEKEGCLHCHQVADVLRQPAIDTRTFDLRRDLGLWPFPENVGISLDRDDGLVVTRVAPRSPAAEIGLAPGDVLAAAGGRRLFSQTDFRGVLHRGPRGAGKLELWWKRRDQPMHGELAVTDGWRKTELGWRKSVAEGNFGAQPGMAWFFPLPSDERKRLGIPAGAMAIRPHYGPEGDWLAQQAGITTQDVIVAVDDQVPDLSGREFLTWFRLRYAPGDRVTYRVLDARGRERKVEIEVGERGRK